MMNRSFHKIETNKPNKMLSVTMNIEYKEEEGNYLEPSSFESPIATKYKPASSPPLFPCVRRERGLTKRSPKKVTAVRSLLDIKKNNSISLNDSRSLRLPTKEGKIKPELLIPTFDHLDDDGYNITKNRNKDDYDTPSHDNVNNGFMMRCPDLLMPRSQLHFEKIYQSMDGGLEKENKISTVATSVSMYTTSRRLPHFKLKRKNNERGRK
jgi:hypothetical protein